MTLHRLIDIQRTMIAAWDGVQSLAASARMAYWPGMVRSDHPRFADPPLADQEVFTFKAWWQHPNRWRHDTNAFMPNRTLLSYVGVDDRWWVWQNGILKRSGTVQEAQAQQLTAQDPLSWGRPYLTPKENAHLWLWLKAAIWVASFAMVANTWSTPLPDAVYGEDVVLLLAGPGLDPQGETLRSPDLLNDWWAVDWNRDQELTDFGNVFQLWVDRRTEFCRRMTSEGSNGRQWDIIVDSLEINAHPIPDDVFCGHVPD